jgi:hypothetical protein
MKQKQAEKMNEFFIETMRTLHYEMRRINYNLSVMHVLVQSMEDWEDNSTHIDIVQSVRLALIDSLGELEKCHSAVHEMMKGSEK